MQHCLPTRRPGASRVRYCANEAPGADREPPGLGVAEGAGGNGWPSMWGPRPGGLGSPGLRAFLEAGTPGERTAVGRESGSRGGITRLPLSPGCSPRPSRAKSARDSPRLLPRKPAEPGGKSRRPRGGGGGDGEPRRARGGDGERRRPRGGDGEARRPRGGDGEPRRPRGGDGEARRPRCPEGERGRRAGVRDEEEPEDGGEVRRDGPEEEPELRPVRGPPPPLSLGRCEETEERAPLRYMAPAAAATAAAPTGGALDAGPQRAAAAAARAATAAAHRPRTRSSPLPSAPRRPWGPAERASAAAAGGWRARARARHTPPRPPGLPAPPLRERPQEPEVGRSTEGGAGLGEGRRGKARDLLSSRSASKPARWRPPSRPLPLPRRPRDRESSALVGPGGRKGISGSGAGSSGDARGLGTLRASRGRKHLCLFPTPQPY